MIVGVSTTLASLIPDNRDQLRRAIRVGNESNGRRTANVGQRHRGARVERLATHLRHNAGAIDVDDANCRVDLDRRSERSL
jgi:hypothetical protein